MTDSHQYLDNDSTYRRKSVKQKCRNLHSETAEICTLRCDYCGRFTKDSDLTDYWIRENYWRNEHDLHHFSVFVPPCH